MSHANVEEYFKGKFIHCAKTSNAQPHFGDLVCKVCLGKDVNAKELLSDYLFDGHTTRVTISGITPITCLVIKRIITNMFGLFSENFLHLFVMKNGVYPLVLINCQASHQGV